jgi:hypothetical protein
VLRFRETVQVPSAGASVNLNFRSEYARILILCAKAVRERSQLAAKEAMISKS